MITAMIAIGIAVGGVGAVSADPGVDDIERGHGNDCSSEEYDSTPLYDTQNPGNGPGNSNGAVGGGAANGPACENTQSPYDEPGDR